MASKQPVMVEVLRGPVVESVHQVLAVVANEVGAVTHYWGHPQYLTFPRSCIKMLQAIPLVESGAAQKFELDDKMIALACASHSGEEFHLQSLQQWAEKVGFKESQLICGPHWPYNEDSARLMVRRGQEPTPFCNNCSGKHSGILTTCRHLGDDLANYQDYSHPAQKRLRDILTETMKVDHSKAAHGVDGCGIPTYAVPLQSIATGMSTFVNSKLAPKRKETAERILRAVRSYPEYVSGSNDTFTVDVVSKTQGRVIVKGGAEGVFTGILVDKKITFAVKCIDGNARAARLVAATLIAQFAGLSAEESAFLKSHLNPVIKNWKGDVVGQLRIAKPS